MRPPTLLIVCFLPDSGHVLPLLRLGQLLQQELQFRVQCLLPPSYEGTVREYGFEYLPLHSATTQWRPEMAASLSRRSIFFNAFSNYSDLSDHYWSPLRESVGRDLDKLIGTMRTIEPQLMLCDSHVFLGWYERLAQSCGARMLINDPEGTLRWQQPAFVQTYGLSDRAGWMRRVVEWAGQASQLWFKLWRAARYPGLRRRVAAMQNAAASSAALAFKDCDAGRPQRFFVNAGLGVLEAAHATVGMKRGEDHEYVLPPTVETHITSLPVDLEQWLDRQPGSVVYICFGTMVALSGNMVAELLDGLLSAGVSVLWSLPASQHSLLAGRPVSERVRIETFVPQRAVLASRKIGCFITHGGAGGSQEAVVFGKPVLCIPFMWDQPYNCSVLARLGMGRVLSKRDIRSRRITAEIRELLGNPSYEESARRLAQEVRELQRTVPHSHDLRQLLVSGSLPLETKAAV